MNTHANELKNCLIEITKEMSSNPQEFSTLEKGCFMLNEMIIPLPYFKATIYS
ncbi:hypothetical protein [Cellulosilyticum ruminicola]|uniref:hypothetical protein n=1 Tax=Cellulosilyticum ruminicola TaxID=425254 RepID=UPI0012ECFF45|nr:hypothetical protein [Cellulosilyticum ruminicola]